MKKSIIIVSISILIITLSSICFGETIGKAYTSGYILKDTLSINAIDDPDFDSIVCYVTTIEIGGPNLENPSNSSISCRLIKPFKGKPTSKNKLFTKAKSPFFKELIVDRFYDSKRNVLIYLSYTKKLVGTNASHSVSVVPLGLEH